jgi:hypothetical protein
MPLDVQYKIVELMDGDIPRYTTICRTTQSFVELAWRDRHIVDNPLMRWLRTLGEPPQERIFLGSNVGLPRRTAVMALQFRRDSIAKMAGSSPDPPDFALWQIHRGGRGRGRAVCRVRDGVVERWSSEDEAAKALKTSRDDIRERINEEHTDREGATWWETGEFSRS